MGNGKEQLAFGIAGKAPEISRVEAGELRDVAFTLGMAKPRLSGDRWGQGA